MDCLFFRPDQPSRPDQASRSDQPTDLTSLAGQTSLADLTSLAGQTSLANHNSPSGQTSQAGQIGAATPSSSKIPGKEEESYTQEASRPSLNKDTLQQAISNLTKLESHSDFTPFSTAIPKIASSLLLLSSSLRSCQASTMNMPMASSFQVP